MEHIVRLRTRHRSRQRRRRLELDVHDAVGHVQTLNEHEGRGVRRIEGRGERAGDPC